MKDKITPHCCLGKSIVESIDVVDAISYVLGNLLHYLIPCMFPIMKESPNFNRIYLVLSEISRILLINWAKTNDVFSPQS